MRDHNDRRARLIQLVKNIHDLLTGGRIQRAGRLVGQQQLRLADNGARDRNALALTAGELIRPEGQTVAQPHTAQGVLRQLTALVFAHAAIEQRQGDVIHGAQLRQQIKALEHKAQQPVTHLGEVIEARVAQILAVEQEFSACRHIQTADQVHQRRLARAGRTHDRKVIPFGDLKIDVLEDVDKVLALRVILADVSHLNQHQPTAPSLVLSPVVMSSGSCKVGSVSSLCAVFSVVSPVTRSSPSLGSTTALLS